MTSCDECGFEYESVAIGDIGSVMRLRAGEFVRALDGIDVHARPTPDVWSPLEYACHVRDVLQVQIGRVARGLAEDTPSFEPMRRDERPTRLRYNEQDPVVVVEQLHDAANAFGDVFDGMTEEHLARTVTYNWPTETIRPLRWVGRHTIHELIHHRVDIEPRRRP